MPHSDLTSCAKWGGVARVAPRGGASPSYRIIPFRCGRLSCPVCRNIRRKRIIRRLEVASWPKQIVFWTITTDPKVMSSADALATINRRWHLLCRELLRRYPGIKFFRVLEFTESGLPHLHVIFNKRVSWHWLQSWVIHHQFGEVLHFKKLPRGEAFAYLTKYLTKALLEYEQARLHHVRAWSASVRFLPVVHYFSDDVEFQIVYSDHLGFRLDRMLHYYELHAPDE